MLFVILNDGHSLGFAQPLIIIDAASLGLNFVYPGSTIYKSHPIPGMQHFCLHRRSETT